MQKTDPRVAFFNRLATTWDESGPPIRETLARLQELRPTLGFAPGQHVLELGCGTGQVTGWLLDAVRPGRVTAIDFAPAMLARARARGVPAEFRCADVCSDDLGTACYDMVFCLHAFPHFRDPDLALRTLARALKPDGRFILLHLDGRENVNSFHAQVGAEVGADHLPDVFTLKELLREAGLQVTTVVDRPDLFCMHAKHSDHMPE
jgi:demethylmenaquinone methyltransferase/2-methoxy-6-polyprenyl-1,4-benzoquinol methylase